MISFLKIQNSINTKWINLNRKLKMYLIFFYKIFESPMAVCTFRATVYLSLTKSRGIKNMLNCTLVTAIF